jgi:sugar (pentulose or hexulose) kinase
MMDLLLGLDVGTTATKGLLFDPQGRVVASASQGYELRTPQSKWVEQDAEELWRAVVQTVRHLHSQINPGDRVLALSQSSQGGTTIPVDEAGRPLHPAISWMDQRAAPQAERVRAAYGAKWIKRFTGWDLFAGLPLQHIAWWRENRPDVFAASRYFLFVNDFSDC